jgi:sensor c-di-GMP phosphodiesterase-like protein
MRPLRRSLQAAGGKSGEVGVLPSARKKLLAVFAGIMLAGGPLLGFHDWLNGVIERQGWEEVDSSARRTISVAEGRLDRVIEGLDKLSQGEVNSCRGTHLDALRQVTFAISPVKELSVVATDGRTVCSDSGLPLAPRVVMASQRAAPAGLVLIELVRVDDHAPVLRVRRPGSGNMLAALVPTDLLILQVATRGGAFNAFARLAMLDGTRIIAVGSEAKEPDGRFAATHRSDRYGLVATVSMARGSPENASELRTLGMLVPAVIAVLLLGFAVLSMRRDKRNPFEEFERALETGQFVPYYQPVVDITTGQLQGAEVLVRWRKPDGTIVMPGSFIPLAESSGLVLEMTRVLMRRASEEIGPAFACRPHLKVAFNLAAQHFRDESIVADVRSIFESSQLKLGQIVLEVTERQPLDDLTETRRVIAALQGIGVRIAIDDVGTGHSGLSYMLKLGVDIMKIDKMFVDALGSDRNSNTIIETLVDLARNMRMEIIAEGVESFDQVVKLRDLGIRSAQGYVFAPPLPGSSFLQLVEALDPVSEDTDSSSPPRYMSARNRFVAA